MSDKALAAFFKTYSESEEDITFEIASDRLGKKIQSIPTGSLLLDDILGCGGYPFGRIIQLYGFAGSGKSVLAMLAIKEAQKLDLEAKQVFFDAEQTFSVLWAQQLGLDTSRIILVDSDSAVNGRRLFEILLGVPKEDKKHVLSGKSKEGLLDKIANKELNINLIVLDSLGAIIPPSEDTAQVGQVRISPLARFLSTTFKKLSLEVSKANIPFLVINHVRSTMDPYGPDHSFAGGNSYAHFLSANIFFEAVQRKDSTIFDDKENKIGHTMRATTEKSKFGPWPKKCEFKLRFDKGIVDQHEEIAKLATEYDVIERPSNVSYVYGEKKWVGAEKFSKAIEEDPIFAAELIQKITEARDTKMTKSTEANITPNEVIVDDIEENVKRGRKKKEEKN